MSKLRTIFTFLLLHIAVNVLKSKKDVLTRSNECGEGHFDFFKPFWLKGKKKNHPTEKEKKVRKREGDEMNGEEPWCRGTEQRWEDPTQRKSSQLKERIKNTA